MTYCLLTRITRPGLPKTAQTFLFFRILKPDAFKLRLKTFVPTITTGETAKKWKLEKRRDIAKTGVNIAFASSGLAAVSCDTNR